jgi:zinc D-Ala-D-Ala carboxypeptidase
MTALSRHFQLHEFDQHDGTPAPAAHVPALRRLCVAHLEVLRRRFGPVRVMSGYRTSAYNRSVGGAPHSYHVYELGRVGVAADVVPQRGTPREWAAWLEAQAPPGGLGIYAGHIHVDTRPGRARWSSTAQ